MFLLFGPSRESAAQTTTQVCATPGKDGPLSAPNGVINTYYPGTTAATTVGATSITLGTSTGAATTIAVGDLLLVIQMQDAVINATNSNAYGDGVTGDPGSGSTISTTRASTSMLWQQTQSEQLAGL